MKPSSDFHNLVLFVLAYVIDLHVMMKFGETENASHKELTWSSRDSPHLLFGGEITMTLGFASSTYWDNHTFP